VFPEYDQRTESTLRVRRTLPVDAIRALPLDSCDMFIVSRLDQAVSLTELAELAPCDFAETMARVRALVELGAVQLFMDDAAEEQEQQRERRSSSAPRERPRRDSAGYGRGDPPTGVRLKLDRDVETRKRALIGAVVLGRLKRA
jgi:hypothetical protein